MRSVLQPEDCADCGTAASAAAVDLHGFEIQEEQQQVYSAVGTHIPQYGVRRPQAKIKARARVVAPKGLDWSPLVSRPLNSEPHSLNLCLESL